MVNQNSQRFKQNNNNSRGGAVAANGSDYVWREFGRIITILNRSIINTFK